MRGRMRTDVIQPRPMCEVQTAQFFCFSLAGLSSSIPVTCIKVCMQVKENGSPRGVGKIETVLLDCYGRNVHSLE